MSRKKKPPLPLLDAIEAAKRRDSGMREAVDHADGVDEEWSDKALEYVVIYARRPHDFMGEEVRAYAHKHGLPEPPDGRAWGGVIRRAAVAGVIERVGYRAQASVSCHRSPKTVWRGSTEE